MNYKVRLGYKVCYKEQNTNKYIVYFKTYTYKQAIRCIKSYRLFPPRAREDNHRLKNPVWKAIPITIKEVIDGIWLEDPF